MSLFQLPPETLIRCFDYVGSSFFRSDLSCLTVCKQWNDYARTACFRDFFITQKTLRRLLSSSDVESSLDLVGDSMENLLLDLKSFEDWVEHRVSVPSSRDDSQAIHAGNVSAWITGLNNDLLCLGTIIKQSRKLRILCVQATSELHPLLRLTERRDYLFLSTIRPILSASNLTSLEIDLCGTQLIPQESQEHSEGFHTCANIAALLPTLRRLRLRMRSICADVLKVQRHGTNLRLNEILINLSLSNESPLTTSAVHATCCSPSSGGFLQLKASIEKQARVLVAQMAAPKVVRVLTHALPSFEIRAYDVLTDSNVRLNRGASWDDEGEAINDEVSDEESEISDLSSDNDG